MNFFFLSVIPIKNVLFVMRRYFLHFVKSNSFIKASFFGSPRKERSTYIISDISSCITKSFHSFSPSLAFLANFSKRISSFDFGGGSGMSGSLGFFVHCLTSSYNCADLFRFLQSLLFFRFFLPVRSSTDDSDAVSDKELSSPNGL